MILFDPTIWDRPDSRLLLNAVEVCVAKEQSKAVLADLLTEKEIKELNKRLHIALLLETGMSYTEIHRRLGVSTATIAEISKKLQYGSGGLQLVLRLIKEQQTPQSLAILTADE